MVEDMRIKLSFFGHYKTHRLEQALGADGVLSLLRLWAWASMERPDGNLSGLDDGMIEFYGKWPGEPGALVKALMELRWLDGKEREYSLHNWSERNPYVAASNQRSEAGRMSSLKRRRPEIYDQLKEAGISRVSQEELNKFLNGYLSVKELLLARENLNTYDDNLTAEPTEEELEQERRADAVSQALAPMMDPNYRPSTNPEGKGLDAMTQKAAARIIMFPAAPGAKKMDMAEAVEWIARQKQRYPKLDLAGAVQAAVLYVNEKKVSVRNVRNFLTRWIAREGS